jgi:3-dehydroquinate synthase
MIDSSVGGKTGVNSTAGKNLIGTFYAPKGVVIDVAALDTLPRRELTAGFCEAIKNGAVGGRSLMNATASFLDAYPPQQESGFTGRDDHYRKLARLIHQHVAFKSKVVAGDERESPLRTDARSRKILNFGHTLAHALEKVTGYTYFRHGEAVGYGIKFAAELSKSLALCDANDVKLLNDVVHRAGTLPPLENIDAREVIAAFSFDKKNLAGSLQMVLIKGVGRPMIVTGNQIPQSAVLTALKRLIRRSN